MYNSFFNVFWYMKLNNPIQDMWFQGLATTEILKQARRNEIQRVYETFFQLQVRQLEAI